MRKLLLVALLALAFPSFAAAADQKKMEEVASTFAMRPVTIWCHDVEEDPFLEDAWGYTYKMDDHMTLDVRLCDQFAFPTGPKMQALAIEVLIHEAYHLREWDLWRDESAVECRAIRHFTVGAQLLGLTKEQAFALKPYAIKEHNMLPGNYLAHPCKI
jgi:hypothetical protein